MLFRSDAEALRAAARGFADFYLAHRGLVREAEINPLIVRAKDAVAVDVRMVK